MNANLIRPFRSAVRGFTLMELLVVISIMALLMGIIVPSYFTIREKAKYTKAKVAVKNLETAMRAYLDHYRVWPGFLKEDTPVPIEGDLFRMLSGENVPAGANPEKVMFFEFDSTNELACYDPFVLDRDPTNNRPYYVVVDMNYDNVIKKDGVDIRRPVLVWSVFTNEDAGAAHVRSWD